MSGGSAPNRVTGVTSIRTKKGGNENGGNSFGISTNNGVTTVSEHFLLHLKGEERRVSMI